MRQMITSVETLYPMMPSPSAYIIEDTHTVWRGKKFRDDPQNRTIYDVAFDVCRQLQDWHIKGRGLLGGPQGRFKLPPSQREGTIPVSDLCRMTRSVSFFDSMIIFQRDERPEPWTPAGRGRWGPSEEQRNAKAMKARRPPAAS